MPKGYKNMIVLWKDAKIYYFQKGQRVSLTSTKCQGELIRENKDFIILKNCQQFVFNKEKKKFVLKRKVRFFFIPKGMITETHSV